MPRTILNGILMSIAGLSIVNAQPLPRARPVSDLSGIWQRESGAVKVRLLIVEIDNEFVGIEIDPYDSVKPGRPVLRGTRVQSTIPTIDCQVVTDRGLMKWAMVSFKSITPDRFEVPEYKTNFTRISVIRPGPVPCDLNSHSRVTAIEAIARGWIYSKLNDLRTAACWYHLGADQGDAEAQMWYGSFLLLGHGVTRNIPEAFNILQKSAMQGSADSAKQMEYMFGNGVGVPRSNQRSSYWKARAELNDEAFIHRGDFLPIPTWAADKSMPCDASNPSHVNEDTAFRAARVAYQARALETASCWFQISERLGSNKASVYLGILYMFGFGVQKNPSLGFQYMQKAANANDAFALMYLANFYRFGLGTKPDHNHGSALVDKALRLPDGLDAFTHIEGTALNAEERGRQLVKGLAAFSSEDTCNDLNAIDRGKSRDCTQTQGWFLGMASRPAHNTVQFPEEIMPENFDFVVPGEIAALKIAARLGLTR